MSPCFSLWHVSPLPSREPIILDTPYSFSPDLEPFRHPYAPATHPQAYFAFMRVWISQLSRYLSAQPNSFQA